MPLISILLFPFMILAAIGLTLSVIAHAIAIAGMTIPGGQLVWSLHAGIFVVWIPTVLISMRTTRYANRKDFWKVALSGCPSWMRISLYALFGYAILNFIFFIATGTSGPKVNGDAMPSAVRGFSGHWMIFYGAAFCVLYSAIHAPELYRERKCSLGHSVAPTARFCPECGRAISELAIRG